MFTEIGIAESTVQHVLERASVSRRTFYQYFSGKEDVLAAVYDEWVDGLVGVIGGAVQRPGTPSERMICALDAWIDHQQRHEPLSASLMVEAARPGSLLHGRRERTLDALVSTAEVTVSELLGVRIDPLFFRGLLLGVEGLIIHLAEHGRLGSERARLRRVVAGLFLGPLGNTADLPGPPR